MIVIGAGLSGICAAWYLKDRCPGRSFAILEARERLGGTWDLFRYPGIRSDSDMYTLGYSFRPWRETATFADGPSILTYLEDTARETGLTEHLRHGLRVELVSWSSEQGRWSVTARRADGGIERFTCDFLWGCTGYYRYDRGHTPALPEVERFRGRVVHPQQWPEGLPVDGRRVLIVGSGATAVTLAPALAAQGARVTLLQRTPTWILSLPGEDPLARRLNRWLPPRAAHRAVRWRNILRATAFYAYCRRYPGRARAFLRSRVADAVGDRVDLRHFDPPYAPWDQRVCFVPDGDLFRAVASGAVTMVTDTIARFTEGGVVLASGAELAADVVVTATGLELQFLGGARIEVDGRPVPPSSTRMYRGAMLSDVPNAAFVQGYTNASWTLKAELACEWVTRVLRHMDAHGYTRCTPRRTDPAVVDRPSLELASGYVSRAAGDLPTQGDRGPWRLRQSYLLDLAQYRAPIDDGVLELRR